MNSTNQDEIDAYVKGVRNALAGLPEATRDELIDDLPEHLTEVMSEGAGTLTERLGTPEAYASELLSAAGHIGGFPDPPVTEGIKLSEIRDDLRDLLGRVDVKIGPVIGYPKASDFLRLLRPGWWLLRGYLAAMAIGYLTDGGGQRPGLLPRLGGSAVLGLLLLAGCLIGSILLARRAAAGVPRPARIAIAAGTAFLVLFGWIGLLVTDSRAHTSGYDNTSDYSGGNPYSDIQDVYVYDSSGHLVSDARLFDQDGSPIQLGQSLPAVCVDPTTGDGTPSRALGYPFCPQYAPFGGPSGSPPAPTPTPTDASPPPDSSPSSDASPSPGPRTSGKAGASSKAGASPSVSAKPGF